MECFNDRIARNDTKGRCYQILRYSHLALGCMLRANSSRQVTSLIFSSFESSLREGSTGIKESYFSFEHLRAIRLFTTDFYVPQVLLTAFCFVVLEIVQNRRLCVPENGLICLVPDIAETGDKHIHYLWNHRSSKLNSHA